MSNPLARLIGQAEFTLGDLSRRAAASIAAPIKAKGQEVVSDVVGAASAALKAIVIRAVLGLMAGVMLLIAVIYAVTAFYWFLLPKLGPVEARLVIAGLFALLGLVALVAMALWPKGNAGAGKSLKAEARAAEAEAQRVMASARAAEAPETAGSRSTDASADLKRGVETLASILGDAGYRREQAGLKTGLALASQLKPMQIVALALIGGYVAGLRYTARRR